MIYFEACFDNGHDKDGSIACKGKRIPTVSEAQEFLKADSANYGVVYEVNELDEYTLHSCFDTENIANWPVFG